MSTFIIKNTNFISSGETVNKNSNLNIEIPTIVENNILSFNYTTFVRITNKTGDSINIAINNGTQSTISENIKINSFGFDDLPLYITNIKNKNSKVYELK